MTPLRIAAAAAVLGVCATACGAQQATAGRPSTPELQLSGAGAAVPGSPQAGSPGLGAQRGSPPSSGPADIEVTGALRASGPSRDAVRQLPGGPAAATKVGALAAALHLTGAPRRSGNGWRVTGPGSLQVSGGPGLHWSYTGAPGQRCGGPLEKYAAADRHAPPPAGPPGSQSAGPQGSPSAGAQGSPSSAGRHGPGPAGGSGAAPAGGRTAAPVPVELTAWTCPQGALRPGLGPESGPASGQEPGSPTSPRAAPSPRAGESAAQPVLDAAGITGSPVRAGVTGGVTSVSADPSVQGLPTAGFPTVVQVAPSGTVVAASGWLSRPVRGAVYPIVSAGQAARALRAAAARPATGGRTGITGVKAPVLRVTGASYGLALGYDQAGGTSRPVLVPAWLLQVPGSAGPVAAVAVSPRYLAAR